VDHLSHAGDPVFFTNRTESVMTGSQFARRWRHCNNVSPPFFPETEEDGWRINMLELLTKAHTLGGITDLSFAVSESYYAVSGVNVFFSSFCVYTAAFDLGSCF
jgi:hypothetical protein